MAGEHIPAEPGRAASRAEAEAGRAIAGDGRAGGGGMVSVLGAAMVGAAAARWPRKEDRTRLLVRTVPFLNFEKFESYAW